MSRYGGGEGLFGAPEIASRGVIKLAPDAIVNLNGAFGATVLEPVTGNVGKLDFQEGISSISIQNSVDPPGSSTASIEIVTPIYNEKSKFWINFKGDGDRIYKIPYFVPMMEVQIYLKGRFLVNDQPKYYPAFWGFVTNVEESFSGGLYKITLQCADMLHWWSYIVVAFRPSVGTDVYVGGTQALTVWGSRYEEANAFEIIYALVREMGFESFFTPDWIAKLPVRTDVPPPVYRQVYKEIFTFWINKFKVTGSLLKMYGATGNLINDPRKNKGVEIQTNFNNVNSPTDRAKQGDVTPLEFSFGIDDNFLKNFKLFYKFSDFSKGLKEAEYMTRLEVATVLKDRVEYEFFQDVDGCLIFKPPFYNLDVRPLMPYRIKPNDILSFSSTINSDEIVTCLQVQTSFIQQVQAEGFVNPVGYHIDIELNKRFGHRFRKETCWWLSENEAMIQSYTVARMSKINSKAYTAHITIPGRPELRLGYPIYIEHKDVFYYVKSINHTFDYGGSFTTTLALEAARPKIYDIDEKTGGWVSQKYMVYSLDINSPVQTQNETPDATKTYSEKKQNDVGNADKNMQEILRNNKIVVSNKPGTYKTVNQKEAALKLGVSEANLSMIRETTIPYTDEFGYQVIGGLRYGRGISVRPSTILDGIEVSVSEGKTKEQIESDLQAQLLVNIRSASDEGSYMKDYFAAAQFNNSPIAALVPSYIKFPFESLGVKPTTASQANQIANMAISQSQLRQAEVPLVKDAVQVLPEGVSAFTPVA